MHNGGRYRLASGCMGQEVSSGMELRKRALIESGKILTCL